MEANPQFAGTRWSLVLAVRTGDGSAAKRALGELCVLYWQPVYCYLRRRGHDPEDAMDLTQGFLARLLEKGAIGNPDPAKGRFRNFLLGAVNHYVSGEAGRARALKRGGGATPLPLDPGPAEERLRREPADRHTPESLYQRQWALMLMEDALAALRQRYVADGKADLFERLHPLISSGSASERYAAIAADLGSTEDAIKMAASRLRKRYRAELRARVAETVADPADIDDELRGLIEALRG